jgi:hypothetical protein
MKKHNPNNTVANELDDLSALMHQQSHMEESKTSPPPTRQMSALDQLRDFGFTVLAGDPFNKYGEIRQLADPQRGIESKGQENYDAIAQIVIRHIQE